MSYCKVCGKERVWEWDGKYKESTGEKTGTEVCPEQPCKHGGHTWGGWKRPFFSLFSGQECGRCKKIWWPES